MRKSTTSTFSQSWIYLINRRFVLGYIKQNKQTGEGHHTDIQHNLRLVYGVGHWVTQLSPSTIVSSSSMDFAMTEIFSKSKVSDVFAAVHIDT